MKCKICMLSSAIMQTNELRQKVININALCRHSDVFLCSKSKKAYCKNCGTHIDTWSLLNAIASQMQNLTCAHDHIASPRLAPHPRDLHAK